MTYLVTLILHHSLNDGGRLKLFGHFMLGFKDKKGLACFADFHHVGYEFAVDLDLDLINAV